MFDLNQLRCFVTVAEELHFGRAAQRLNMTQPPLSRQVQVLERIIGADLLERTSRTVRLTVAGRSFLPEAKRILKLAESAAQVARRISEGKAGSLKIGFTAATAYGFLPELVRACLEALPEVDLSLKEMVSGEQIEALATGQIDVGLLRPPVSRPDLFSLRVVAEPLLAALPVGHALAARAVIEPQDFAGQPFVMYSPYESRYFYDLVIAQFAGADVSPRYVQHIGQIHSILAMVRAGLGLAIVPAAAANLAFSGVVLKPFASRVAMPVELFLAWPRTQDNPLLPLIVDLARGMIDANPAH